MQTSGPTCCSLGNGSKGNKQHQQLRAGEMQQAGGLPSGEEERRQDSHVNHHHCCQQHCKPKHHPAYTHTHAQSDTGINMGVNLGFI